jgi:hypothetical protein
LDPPPGRVRIIEGMKGTIIIDDTYNSSPAAVLAALDTLKMVNGKRKIAVLGDMLELGRYSAEAHKHVGERVAETAHLLRTVGFRARAIAESAMDAGMKETKIMQYEMNEAERAGKELEREFQATEHLLKHGWVMLPKNTPSYAPPIFEGFERLIVAPLQVQTGFRITDPNEYYAGTPDLGLLVTRKGELKQHPRSDEIAEGRTRYDRSKFLFHFNDRVLPKLIAQGAAIEPYRQMILSGWNVDIAATILAYTVTTYMDQIAPGYRFSERMALDTLWTSNVCQ